MADPEPKPEWPHVDDMPGMWPSTSANSFRQQYLAPGDGSQPANTINEHQEIHETQLANDGSNPSLVVESEERGLEATSIGDEKEAAIAGKYQSPSQANLATNTAAASDAPGLEETSRVSSEKTHVATPPSRQEADDTDGIKATEAHDDAISTTPPQPPTEAPSEDEMEEGGFAPIKTGASKSKHKRPGMASKTPSRMTSDDIYKALSRKRTTESGRQGSYISPQVTHSKEEMAEIERLLSRMFGKNRHEQSEDEKTRHVGLVFKNLTVKGLGLGAALQPTLGDIFLNFPRALAGLFSKNGKTSKKPPVRTIIDNFTGCVRPGEMLLVLGAPGSGCSTFLKVLANQRYGYEKVEGDVTYGGTDAKTMGQHYRGEVVYNPEDDLHYATLSVKNTFDFARGCETFLDRAYIGNQSW